MSILKIGLIGCGRIVQSVHLNNLKKIDGVEIIALADPVRSGAAGRGQKEVTQSGRLL
jgi:predicted dehydrogenase